MGTAVIAKSTAGSLFMYVDLVCTRCVAVPFASGNCYGMSYVPLRKFLLVARTDRAARQKPEYLRRGHVVYGRVIGPRLLPGHSLRMLP